MSKTVKALYNIRLLEKIAQGKSRIHCLHPNIKVMITLCFIAVTISFDRFDVIGLMPLFAFPIMTIQLGQIPYRPILKRILVIMPLIIGIGIFNPLLSDNGWTVFASLILKSILTVSATLVLVATTPMEQLGYTLRRFRVPKIFVLQILLTYRYISLLIEELSRMLRAYSLRAPGKKGISMRDSGNFLGHLLLRTIERAERVYISMRLRGFEGEFDLGSYRKVTAKEFGYCFIWLCFFIIVRCVNIPQQVGVFIMEVF